MLVRTGTLRYWGKDGANHKKVAEHDSAGITLATAKYLVEKFGAALTGITLSPTQFEFAQNENKGDSNPVFLLGDWTKNSFDANSN